MGQCCCGFGHREFYQKVENDLRNIVKSLVVEKGITVFLTGGMGQFDSAFSSAVLSCKKDHKEIQLVLVKPYFTNDLNVDREYYEKNFDDVVIPIEIAGCYYKSAIVMRNKWMVDQSDVVLSGVYRDFGGAFQAIQYAKRKQKQVIELCSNKFF